jgi:hypothetical protein
MRPPAVWDRPCPFGAPAAAEAARLQGLTWPPAALPHPHPPPAQSGGAGAECAYQLVAALQEALANPELRAAAATSSYAAAPARAAAADSAQAGAGPGSAGARRVLLRLDHMRNRAMYSRKIRGWVKELGLTGVWRVFWGKRAGGRAVRAGCPPRHPGPHSRPPPRPPIIHAPGRLIFCRALILITLEGPGCAVAEYLVRARTENVDVDSAGRKVGAGAGAGCAA